MYWAACIVRRMSGKGGSGKEQAMHLVQEGGTGTSGNETNYQLCYYIYSWDMFSSESKIEHQGLKGDRTNKVHDTGNFRALG